MFGGGRKKAKADAAAAANGTASSKDVRVAAVRVNDVELAPADQNGHNA